jgi:hypothetical protein
MRASLTATLCECEMKKSNPSGASGCALSGEVNFA